MQIGNCETFSATDAFVSSIQKRAPDAVASRPSFVWMKQPLFLEIEFCNRLNSGWAIESKEGRLATAPEHVLDSIGQTRLLENIPKAADGRSLHLAFDFNRRIPYASIRDSPTDNILTAM